ncbi:MFS transporter [Jatrophihabitans telluris]|uniref:MFS transporter n=1 Tax=Jatrophihabitans telluris TaxID=2038343 RepID=A0ABY4QYP2_9ACTN|nr:MFS transporter [Jatrophihabitans telluris]UQX88643.1 MFS transporter [Jatrophihabitans telluris]
MLDATIVNIALPDIQSALSFSPTNLSWVLNAYTLAFGGLLLLGARAGDLYGRKRVFLAGIALFTVASLAGGLTDSAALLLAARFVQGIGAAFASPSALALLMITFSEGRERTRALGLYTAVSIGGSAVGLITGGILIEWVSWRWVFFVNVPIGLALLALARISLTETARNTGKVDVPGAVTSTFGMGAIVYGIVRAASDGWADQLTIGSLAFGVVLLGLFALVETRASMPITPLRMFTNRTRNLSYLARLTLVASMFGMFFFLTQFLQDVLHYSALMTGLAFLPLTIALFAASQLSTRELAARIDPRVLMAAGITLSGLGMLWLTQLSATSGYAMILGPLVMVGLGNGTAFVPLTSAALAGVEPKDAGAASGLVNVMQQVGGSLGLAALVTVFGSASKSALHAVPAGDDPRVYSFVQGAQSAFAVAAGLLAVTVVLVLLMRSTHRPHRGTELPSERSPIADEIESLEYAELDAV